VRLRKQAKGRSAGASGNLARQADFAEFGDIVANKAKQVQTKHSF
jgi:hypothetical protein